ncbi:MAG: GDP-L-fucose synthase [Pseudomonadota bacterium]|nr:GDP-L-fucose synthase [Pseudomonadota bacterium]
MATNVFVAGHKGMVGSAIVRALQQSADVNLVSATRDQLDLTDSKRVGEFLNDNNITQVFLAAAKVGGIQANNQFPADFIHQNLMIEANVIHSAHVAGIDKLLFLGSSCIYPKLAPQPIQEEHLLTGYLEPTNEPYAIAKIAGIKLCESYNRQYGRDYRSVMPTNLYGPEDNFNLESSHVIPALIRKFHDAKSRDDKSVTIWGTGTPRREFLHVDDMAAACVYVMGLPTSRWNEVTEPMRAHLNVGCGEDISILELAQLVKRVVGFDGDILLDTSKPDGTPRKLLCIDRIKATGWEPTIDLEPGLSATYEWFLSHSMRLRT